MKVIFTLNITDEETRNDVSSALITEGAEGVRSYLLFEVDPAVRDVLFESADVTIEED